MTTLLDQVRRAIEVEGLFSRGETVVAGVSGGPDSLCLLHLLCRLKGEYDLALHIAHLHHGLRGAEADADAEFVRALAADWGLPCAIERVDVPALAREHRLAIEEAARRARYAFLGRVAATAGATAIAVGHNADDQAETVLMHWLRGAGLAGLRGMLPRTPLAGYRLLDLPEPAGPRQNPQSTLQNLYLIRPLLDVPRAEIEAYCAYYGLAPRFDRSNLDTTYFRNWLRHEVLPLLAQHNPNVGETIRRSARVIADDYALLRSLLDEAWARVVLEEPDLTGFGKPVRSEIVLDRAAWRALPAALQRSMLREAVHRLRRTLRDITFVHVENALEVARDGTTGDQATLPQGLMLTVGYDRLTIAGAETQPALPDWPLLPPGVEPVRVLVPGETPLPGGAWLLQAEVVGREELPAGWAENADPWRATLDARCAEGGLWLRTRRPGDRFQPQGMGGRTVKLSDFYTNQKVPRAVRDRVPLLAGAAGIAWVCGWRVDERARVGEGTEPILLVRFVRGRRVRR